MRNIRYLLEKYVDEQDQYIAPLVVEKDRVRVYPLTQETKDEIIRLADKGMKPTKIAEKTGRSVTAIRNVIKLARQASPHSSEQSPRTAKQSCHTHGSLLLRPRKGVHPLPPHR